MNTKNIFIFILVLLQIIIMYFMNFTNDLKATLKIFVTPLIGRFVITNDLKKTFTV